MTEVCDAGGRQVKAWPASRVRFCYANKRHIGWAERNVSAYHSSYRTGTVNASSQNRKRVLAAWMCLFAAVALYAPLAGGAWSAYAMACCTGDHCPIAQHHHQKKQASPHAEMDCGHDMGEMMSCAMSCCQNSEKPLVTAVAFVLPDAAFSSTPISIVGVAETAQALEIPRPTRPLSPPPRLAGTL
jgi:hypothetical protein